MTGSQPRAGGMKRTVVIDVPQHLVVSIFVGLGLWAITGDWQWAYAYTAGAIVPIIVAARWSGRRPERRRDQS